MTDRERIIKLFMKYGRVRLGVDGNAAFALVGPDLQEGESVFVELPQDRASQDEVRGCRQALAILEQKAGCELLHYFDDSIEDDDDE